MQSVFINGLGIIHPQIREESDVYQEFNKVKGSEEQTCIIPSFISSRKIRRLDRLTTIALYSTSKALADLDNYNSHEIGTVFNSVFGPLNTCLKFGESVVKGAYSEASPVVFANTVVNACLGHICQEFGLKGASTMLMGSNYVGYAMKLIEGNRAKSILAGGVEEYNKDVFDTFNKQGIQLNEGATTLLLSNEMVQGTYCEILSYAEGNLGGHPCFSEEFLPCKEEIKRTIYSSLEKANVDTTNIAIVITSSNNKDFSEIELSAIKDIFGNYIDIVKPKEVLGETLGASLGMNIAIGALILKHQKIPKGFGEETKVKKGSIRYILVNDFNVSGGYHSFVLKEKEQGEIKCLKV